MGFDNYWTWRYPGGRFVFTGNLYYSGRHGSFKQYTFDVRVPWRETSRTYLVLISPNMLSAYGGDFDEDDTIFTDIYAIDGLRRDSSNGYGGVWDHHWGPYGSVRNQAISTYVGNVNHYIRFRIAITGDNHVGASILVMEL